MRRSQNERRSHGNSFFFCGKRLVFGPDVRNLVFTLILIIAPMVGFCATVGRQLMKNFPHHWGNAIMVVAVVHTFVVLVTLLLTAARDPGIIPRSQEEESNGSSSKGPTKPPIEEIVNGKTVKRKYCGICHHHRPLRCSHCSICNNCIDRFDHHCPWTGQCIGRRNYPFYYMFIYTSTLLCFFVISMCALRIKKLVDGDPSHSILKAFQRSPVSVFLMVYCFLASWFVGGLTVFHSYLIGTNQTTYENFRYRYYENEENPYDKGAIRNYGEVFCTRIPPSKIIGRQQHDEDMGNRTVVDNRRHAHGDDIELGSKNNQENSGFSQSDEGLRYDVNTGHVYPLPMGIHPHPTRPYL